MTQLTPELIKKASNPELAFRALPAIAELRRRLDALEAEAIEIARTKGASWREIAEALGVTRQALQQRIATDARRRASDARPGSPPDVT